MKKFSAIFALFCAMISMVSCGGSSSQKPGELGGECYPDKTCDEGLICNKSNNLCVEFLTLGNICTGQTSCYNDSDEIDCPTLSSNDFYGQDAQYISKCTPKNFTDNGFVIIDNNTGLVWEKSPSSDLYTWNDKYKPCKELNESNYAGIEDWRVPNPLELLTIANSDFTEMRGEVWTSIEDASHEDVYGFYVYLGVGGIVSDVIESDGLPTHAGHKVLCVGGEYMKNRGFTRSSKTVTDNMTGLMWQKDHSEEETTWKGALNYCKNLNDENYSGYSDWRLPNKNELASLLIHEIDNFRFRRIMSLWSGGSFWSSSTYPANTDHAWGVSFFSGGVLWDSKTGTHYVLCVRSAE